MSRAVLVVEDEKHAREAYVAFLRKSGWMVASAANGARALDALRSGRKFDIMLLDLALPDMSGFDVVDRARSENLDVPPICIVSAHLDQKATKRFITGKMAAALPKPVSVHQVSKMLAALVSGNETVLANLPPMTAGDEPPQLYRVEHEGSPNYMIKRPTEPSGLSDGPGGAERVESLSDKVRVREEALSRYCRGEASRQPENAEQEPLLIVARRWNSWYPAVFPVTGGCYAILGAKAAKGQTPGAVIDPGFRALEALQELKLPVGCLGSCVVTHNHPDHIGGIFEYLAARNAAGQTTRLFCNKSVRAMLAPMAGLSLAVRQFTRAAEEIIPAYPAVAVGNRSLMAKPLPTLHQNIGARQGTCGVVLASETTDRQGARKILSTGVLLGDTDYNGDPAGLDREAYRKIRRVFRRPDLKVAVLHIGSSQMKSATGKHLYLPGLTDLLDEIDHGRRRHVPGALENRLLVLVSEWGLEHATADQLARVMPEAAAMEAREKFGSDSLVLETIRVLNEICKLKTIILLPADIGLTVGLESGKVYLPGGDVLPPEEVAYGCDERGVTYRRKTRNVRRAG